MSCSWVTDFCWKLEDLKSFTQVDQERAVEYVEEIEFDKKLQDTEYCLAELHSQYGSVVGQVNPLQSRAHYNSSCRCSRRASVAAGPMIFDVRALNNW